MKRILLIGAGVMGVLIAAFVIYSLVVPPKSPPDTASISDRGLDINVSYSRPSKRGRLIFGEEKDGALQPYGKYWRLGANAATEITFSKNITFAGHPLDAGSYRMYAVPGAESFQVVLNSELGVRFTAAGEPDHSLDVLSVNIPNQVLTTEVEKFTISFGADSLGVNMDMAWDKTLIRVPIAIRQ